MINIRCLLRSLHLIDKGKIMGEDGQAG